MNSCLLFRSVCMKAVAATETISYVRQAFIFLTEYHTVAPSIAQHHTIRVAVVQLQSVWKRIWCSCHRLVSFSPVFGTWYVFNVCFFSCARSTFSAAAFFRIYLVACATYPSSPKSCTHNGTILYVSSIYIRSPPKFFGERWVNITNSETNRTVSSGVHIVFSIYTLSIWKIVCCCLIRNFCKYMMLTIKMLVASMMWKIVNVFKYENFIDDNSQKNGLVIW